MKKPVFIFAVISSALLFLSCATTEVERPLWADLETLEQVYPSSKYIARIGEGSNEKQALIDSEYELAAYFSKVVSSSVVSSEKYFESDGAFSDSEKELLHTVNVVSEYDLGNAFHTKPYFDKSQKQWIVCSYLEREKEFNKYEEKILIAKKNWENVYKNAIDEKSPFKKISILNSLSEKGTYGNTYLTRIQFGKLIMEKGAQKYLSDLDNISKIESLILKTKNTVSFGISADKDSKDYSADLAKAFNKAGFSVPSEKGLYTAELTVLKNRNVIDEMVIYQPEILVKIHNSDEILMEYISSYASMSAFLETEALLEKKFNDIVTKDLTGPFYTAFENRLEKLYN